MSLNKWEIFQKRYEEDIALIHYALENSGDEDYPEAKEFHHLINWLFETEHNPYGIFHKNPESANLMYSARGFATLGADIHHAICDDGDICYPVVGNQPSIYLGWEHDKEVREKLLGEDAHFVKIKKEMGIYKPPTLVFLETAYDFTKAYDEYIVEREKELAEFQRRRKEWQKEN